MNKFFIGLFVGLTAIVAVESNIFYESDPWNKIDTRLIKATTSSDYNENYPIAEKYLEEQKKRSHKHNQKLIEALELFLSVKKLTKSYDQQKCDSDELALFNRIDKFLSREFLKNQFERVREIFEDVTIRYSIKCPNAEIKWKRAQSIIAERSEVNNRNHRDGFSVGDALMIGTAFIGR